MDVQPTQGSEQRDARGRWLPGVAPTGARPWKKGQAPNPTGKGGDFQEALKLARQTSMRSITRLIELRESADEQIATVASKALWEISWGKPKDYDPKAEEVQERPPFDPSLYSTEELRRMQEVMLMIAQREAAGGRPGTHSDKARGRRARRRAGS